MISISISLLQCYVNFRMGFFNRRLPCVVSRFAFRDQFLTAEEKFTFLKDLVLAHPCELPERPGGVHADFKALVQDRLHPSLLVVVDR